MEENALHCGVCGTVFTPATGAAGEGHVVHCPVCDAEVSTPATGEEKRENPLRLIPHGRLGAPRDAQEREDIPEPEVPSASSPGARPSPNARKPSPVPFFWLLVAALGAWWWWRTGSCSVPDRAAPPPAAEVADPAARLAEARARIQNEWDREYPLAEQGDDLDLEYQTGRVIRGRLVRRIENHTVDVLTEQGRTRVAYEDLRPPSRRVVDPDYRARRLEEEAARAAGYPVP